jgi:ATP-dependent DNA helicase RecQ
VTDTRQLILPGGNELPGSSGASVHETLRRVWGFTAFLPLQQDAVRSVLEGRDSLVVLPTGGGKSLCYQAPAVHLGKLAIVVSPLIALMKDQVDGLKQDGVHAAYLNSSQSGGERAAVERDLARGALNLLYIAPERLTVPGFADRLRHAQPAFVAIDEAHCISQWGHDFRPEYRQLRVLRQLFPGVAVHAYTATATPEVRADIVSELRLRNARVLVGNFDRPNLVYRVQSRTDRLKQVLAAIERHAGQAGIVYCIRRSEVDDVSAALVRRGVSALPYHAGLDDAQRRRNQDAFVNERVDVVVATVAFGMGIDRSNVRYVVHAGMPKSLEHYQQEAGRAGRDGLEAECLLLWSGADYGLWKSVMERDGVPGPGALRKLGEMFSFCQDPACRHRALARYFGQEHQADCGACDVCLGEVASADGSAVIAENILKGVAELGGRFGATHVADVLTGGTTERIRVLKHDKLVSYATLTGSSKHDVRTWIDQLMGQGLVTRTGDEYPTLVLTANGARVLRGEMSAGPLSRMAKPVKSRSEGGRRRGEETSGEATAGEATESGREEHDLFEDLRALRREIAAERGVPPYLIFSDASLRDMARLKPVSEAAFLQVKGVGEWKREAFGERFLELLRKYR